MNDRSDDGMHLHVIVRAAGERTADYCRAELARQTSATAVDRVELTPFWRTLREGLRLGLESGAPWILSVDGDILPAPDAVRRVQGWIDRADSGTGVISGMFIDKLLGGARFGGVRVYRSAVIRSMLEVMPAQGENMRPESTAITRLAERGWKHEKMQDLVGLHDYEQFYRDIYRKAFFHMRKHGYAAGRFFPLWNKLAADDRDYGMALGGAADALMELAEVDCDASHTAYKPDPVMVRLGLQEKGPLVFNGDRYREEVEQWRSRIDAGDVEPVEPMDQDAYDTSRPVAEVLERIERVGNNLRLLASISPEAQVASLHQIRRAVPDLKLLDTFSLGELLRYAAGRIFRRRGR